MARPSLQILLAVTVIGAGVYYYWFNGAGPGAEIGEWQKTLPKTYLVKAETSSFNEEGALTSVLTVAAATMFPLQKESLLEQPKMYRRNADNGIWTAYSDSGLYDHRRDFLDLSENVVLRYDPNNVTMKTEKMRVNFRHNTAVSRTRVVITDGTNSTRADGLFADMDTQTVKLQPNVETTYVQPTR